MTGQPNPRKRTPAKPQAPCPEEIRPGQSIELLKELHTLTRERQLHQD